jgi:hypothetical protein
MKYFPGIPLKQELCHAVQGIHATVTSLFLKRIIVFAVGRSGAAGTKKINYAENEQICPDSNEGLKDGARTFSAGKRPVVRRTDSLRRSLCLATKLACGDKRSTT